MSEESKASNQSGNTDAPRAATQSATRTAVRPVGKRQLSGQAVTTSDVDKAKEVANPDKEKGSGTASKLAAFPGEVKDEMSKVVWPTGRQMLNYTLVVFAFLIIVTALVAGVDFLAGLGVEAVLVR